MRVVVVVVVVVWRRWRLMVRMKRNRKIPRLHQVMREFGVPVDFANEHGTLDTAGGVQTEERHTSCVTTPTPRFIAIDGLLICR